jgi:hypothetical protein
MGSPLGRASAPNQRQMPGRVKDLQDLSQLKALYDQGVNIIEHLTGLGVSRSDAVAISYDLQAGSYIEAARRNREYLDAYAAEIAAVIDGLGVAVGSLLEAGVGEGTTLRGVRERLRSRPAIGGFDISWSRAKFARAHLSELPSANAQVFLADLFRIPLPDDSIDVVYTSHSIEPNVGREGDAVAELFRVAGKFLVLLEPSYESASAEGQRRMDRLGYIRGLPRILEEGGYKVVERRLTGVCANPLNPTCLTVIEKSRSREPGAGFAFVCPISRQPLVRKSDCYWSPGSLRAYPVLGDIPCLCPANSIVATHLLDFDVR